MCQVQVKSKVTMKRFTFWGLGLVRRDTKSPHSPKVLGKCPRRVLHEYEGHARKGQGQGQVTKVHYKIKVTNMPCDACFLGHFARRSRWWQSFDPMTSSNLTFDGGQFKVRSRSGQIFKSIFLHKKHMFLVQNFLRIPNMSLVFLYDA